MSLGSLGKEFPEKNWNKAVSKSERERGDYPNGHYVIDTFSDTSGCNVGTGYYISFQEICNLYLLACNNEGVYPTTTLASFLEKCSKCGSTNFTVQDHKGKGNEGAYWQKNYKCGDCGHMWRYAENE